MAANTVPIVVGTVDGGTQTFVNADGTAAKAVYTAGANGARIDSVSITSTDTTARTFNVIINDGAADHIVGWIVVPITAGTDGVTKGISLLTSINLPWLSASGSVFLKAGWILKLAAQVAVTAAKTVDVVAMTGAY